MVNNIFMFMHFFASVRQKKNSILIHICIEMNPDANEQNSVYLKQVPGLHGGIDRHHREEYQSPSSVSIKTLCDVSGEVRWRKQGKTFEHSTVFTRELMLRLDKPQFDKQTQILRHAMDGKGSH